ncbi:MAG: ABC transporter ATP-binding protein/permease [Scytonematopsis contorta HA4267-MV1]|jgi:subfamily B ATP-binding cassette protein MsbA|nr:ABC transporter ATP-binding protein/permease [Scytonematopsis contorta HA4267-MV1]
MLLKRNKEISHLLKQFFKGTGFWQDNYLILQEIKKFKKYAVLAFVFSSFASIFEGITIGFLLSFLQNLTTPNAAPVHTGIEWFDILFLGVNASVINRLYRVCILILLSIWVTAGFNYFGSVNTELVQLNLADRLQKRIFEQLQSLPLSFFAKSRSGELLNTITTEIEKLKQWFSGVSFLFTRGLTTVVYFSWMFTLSWQLTIISFMLFALLAVGLSTLNARTREGSFNVSTANANFTSVAIEFINGIRTVQAFTTQDFERKRFYKAANELLNSAAKVSLIWNMVRPLAQGLASTVLISMLALSFTIFSASGNLQVASLLTYFFVLFRVVPMMQDINGTRAYLSTLYGAAENIKKLVSTDDKHYPTNGTKKFYGLNRSIQLVSVDFGYEPKNLVLENVTLSIERGKTTALVGQSGAGKSTLVDLIPRFYDVTDGHLLIDGINVREFDMNSLRQKMAIVSQDTFIFNTSVWNNIAYGSTNASEAEIREAARLANALNFVEEMPEGFDTVLGDRGVRLSGGQRQRIAIARALLRDPEILILDEATSALDSVSERLIQESIEKLSVGRTVIAIAHRLSTIAKADKVVVLEAGRVIEQGNYQELLEQEGALWKYHQMQHQVGTT